MTIKATHTALKGIIAWWASISTLRRKSLDIYFLEILYQTKVINQKVGNHVIQECRDIIKEKKHVLEGRAQGQLCTGLGNSQCRSEPCHGSRRSRT